MIDLVVTRERFLKAAMDKIRQGQVTGIVPAIRIRQLESLQNVMTVVSTPGQRDLVLQHAAMVVRASSRSSRSDRNDVVGAYQLLVASSTHLPDE